MKFWRKRHESESTHRGVSAIAAADAPREEWIHEALYRLSVLTEADRIGVWLEPENPCHGSAYGLFRGAVWDRDSSSIPAEWGQLSTEAPLPQTVLAATGSAAVDLRASREGALVGPLLELRHALWVPVQAQGHLRGVILAGSKSRSFLLAASPVESVAAELALAVERSGEQHRSRAYLGDLEITRGVLQALSAKVLSSEILNKLVESCADPAGTGKKVDGLFAAIGVLDAARRSPSAVDLRFLWSAGDRGASAALQSGVLREAWRTALETQRTVGEEFHGSSPQGMAGRAVAIPLMAGGHLCGALVAILPAPLATLATLARLELRASLVAAVLSRKQSEEEDGQRNEVQRTVIHSSGQAVLLVDSAGEISELSLPAQDLLVAPSPAASRQVVPQAGSSFPSLFRASDRNRASDWLQHQAAPRSETEPSEELQRPLELQLEAGSYVRVHSLGPSANGAAVLLLEPLAARSGIQPANTVETELRNVIEWLEEGVILFDARENVRAMNIRFEQMAGFSSDESGKYTSLAALIARLEGQAADPLAFAERWRSLARGMEGGIREELQLLHPVPRVLERSARPILDPIGRLLGRVEIYRDLTAQRVFQSKLLQTEKLAALGQMLTGVAHELSNPLTTVLGYAQRLLTRRDAAGRSEEAQQIYQEAERASRILRQLLSHARETPPERRTLALNQVVLRTLELRRFALSAGKINVELDLDPVLPSVRGDAGQLQQVLMNLIGNAQQAIEQQGRGGTIRVRTRCEESRVLLSVEDTGPGVPQAIQARVFDPFFTTKPAGIGTGLGLSIVLSIAREHGGHIRVTSPPGKGATFTVDLPAVALRGLASADPDTREQQHRKRDRAAPPADPIAIGIPSQPAHAPNGKRVMVVEDEPTVARFIADVLEDEGFSVLVLLDGREALERAARESFDLVICDMKMPGLDGQHFYKSLKRMGHASVGSFLFVTGDTVSPATQAFLTQNHLPYLSKPFRMEELTEHVWSALREPDRGAQPPVSSRRSAARNG